MTKLRVWVVGAGEICYSGLRRALSTIQEVSEINQLPVDAVTDSLRVATSSDIYILCFCQLRGELIPLCVRMNAGSSKTRVLVWSHDKQLNTADVLRSGASAYVCSCAMAELTRAIQALYHGYQYFDMEGSRSSSPEDDDLRLSQLTPRQRQIQLLASFGLSDKEIGSELGISPHTVRSHLRAIFEISGVRRRTGLSNTSNYLGG